MADEAGVERTEASEPPRVVTANRAQVQLRPLDLESLLAADHRARAIWTAVEQLDLSQFYAAIHERGGDVVSGGGEPAAESGGSPHARGGGEGRRGACGGAGRLAARGGRGEGRPGAGVARGAGLGGVAWGPGGEARRGGQGRGPGVHDRSRGAGDEDGGRRVSPSLQRATGDGGRRARDRRRAGDKCRDGHGATDADAGGGGGADGPA